MRFSVITATFNRASTLERCLKSIELQSYHEIEKVIIDGGSSDNSDKIINKYILRNDIYISEKDEGIYDALNKGINLSTGDIICFLHSDDFYSNNDVIKNIAEIFKSNSKIDVVYGDVRFFSKKNVNKILRDYKSDKLSYKNLSWGKMPAHPAIFIKKNVYEKIGLFNKNYKIASDYEFLCRLVSSNFHFNFFYYPENLIHMQQGGISTSGFFNTLILNIEVFKALKSNNIYTNIFMLISKYPKKLLQFIIK